MAIHNIYPESEMVVKVKAVPESSTIQLWPNISKAAIALASRSYLFNRDWLFGFQFWVNIRSNDYGNLSK